MIPKTTREHIISLQGHVTGLKRDISNIKTNHLKHMHEDIDKLGGKVDRIYWVHASPYQPARWHYIFNKRIYIIEYIFFKHMKKLMLGVLF